MKNCEPGRARGLGAGLGHRHDALGVLEVLVGRLLDGVARAARAVPAGSPPWITKSGTMRWNVVPSKNFLSARYLKEPPVIGESFESSVISMSPQVVETVAT